MRALLIDTSKGASVVDIKDFHDIQTRLGVDIFDIVSRQIGNDKNAIYVIYVDDCGLLKGNPIVSAFDTKGVPHLVGNLLVARHNDDGEQIPLTDDDLNYLEQWCFETHDLKRNMVHHILMPVDYPV